MTTNDEPAALRILWVTPKWSVPATDGAKVAADTLARAVIGAGAIVDVLSICPADDVVDIDQLLTRWGARRAEAIRRPLPRGRVAKLLRYSFSAIVRPRVPITFSSFRTREIREAIFARLESGEYDVMLLEGLHLCVPFLTNGTWSAPASRTRIVLRAHNIEQDLWTEASRKATNPLLTSLLRWQGRLVAQFERVAVTHVDAVAAIASDDLSTLVTMGCRTATWLPLGLDFSAPVPLNAIVDGTFLFIGRLDWPPNVDALRWLLKNIWPAVIQRRPSAILKIVGAGDTAWLDEYRSIEGVRVIGFVATLADAYRDAAFCVVPMTYGSGTRIKVVESFAMGRTLISTAMGVQGSGAADSMYCRADSTGEWIELLSTITLDEQRRMDLAAARETMAADYDYKTVGRRAYSWLRDVVAMATTTR